MISAREALQRLRQGNQRFVSGRATGAALGSHARRSQLVDGQAPFAALLGCSDSRVPAELVFDQGFGDLFVIRVAGNIVAPSQIASVEFAVEQFGTPLVVVLGHTLCGAIAATVDAMTRHVEHSSEHLRSIVDRVWDAVEPLMAFEDSAPQAELLARAGRANVRASVAQLRDGSDVLAPLLQSGEVWVVGAESSLETGEVDFFAGVPADA